MASKRTQPKYELIAIPLPKGQRNYSGVFYEDLDRKVRRHCRCEKPKPVVKVVKP
jgi:hypothetical protein